MWDEREILEERPEEKSRAKRDKDRVKSSLPRFRVREKIKEISSRFELCEIRERNLRRSKEIVQDLNCM